MGKGDGKLWRNLPDLMLQQPLTKGNMQGIADCDDRAVMLRNKGLLRAASGKILRG